MEKWFSRKLLVCVSIIAMAFFLKSYNKLDDWAFVVLVLVPSMVYLFVNGAIKINSLKVGTDKFSVDVSKCDEEDNR